MPYNLFEKWYKDTRHKLVPVQVDVLPASEPSPLESSPSKAVEKMDFVRILVDIRMTNGMHIQQRHLDYADLRRLVENLEVLC